MNKKNIKSWIQSFFIALFIMAIVAVLVILFNYYIVDSVIVLGQSMVPTYEYYDKVYISRTFRITGYTPKRGQIISCEEPLNNGLASNENPLGIYDYESHLGFWNSFNSNYRECIKRVIGLPGEHIEIKDGNVYINGEKLEENYLDSGIKTNSITLTNFTVPEDSIFVLGDNRSNSKDSREFGCIPFERIDGIAY